MAWRCRLLAARRSQHGRVIVHPTHCLICAQVTLTIGGLWVEVHMNYIYGHIAAWAPLENNQAPDKLGLLRAQQMFFVTAPLHTLAIFQGTQDSWKILFAAKDASRWASFDSINAITTAKLWVLTMMVMLSSSIVVGLVRIGTAKKPFDEIERWLGVVMSFVFLSLTAVPSAAMFFHKRVTSCVEIKNSRRVRPESSRRPPRHRRNVCSKEPAQPRHRREMT